MDLPSCKSFDLGFLFLQSGGDVIRPRRRPLLFFLQFHDLINIGLPIWQFDLQSRLFRPFVSEGILSRPRNYFVQFGFVVDEVATLGGFLSWLLAFLDFEILAVLNLLEGVHISLMDLVAFHPKAAAVRSIE